MVMTYARFARVGRPFGYSGVVFLAWSAALGGCGTAGGTTAGVEPNGSEVASEVSAEVPKTPRQLAPGGAQGDPVQLTGRIRLYWDYHGLTQDGRPPFAEVTHPDLEGAIVNVSWASIETSRGVYDLDVLEAEIAWWASQGKRVIIRNAVLGGVAGESLTPAWVYAQGVPAVSFRGKPSDAALTVIPRVWDSPLFLSLYHEYIAALAAQYDGDPRVEFVSVGVGHLGSTVADATDGGKIALPAAGWTKAKWDAYIQNVVDLYGAHFAKTPLLVVAGPLWTRTYRGERIVPEMQGLAADSAAANVSLLLKGLDPDAAAYASTPFSEMLNAVGPLSYPSAFTLMMGDDWPLWVDEERRANNPNEADRDDAGFAAALQTALAEWDRLGRQCDFVLVLLQPEIQVTNPNHPLYRPEVGAILDRFLAEGTQGTALVASVPR